jgi:hypothetical protein
MSIATDAMAGIDLARDRRRPAFAYASLIIGLFLLCAGLRIGIIRQQGLWADEIFSLAMATGHSLEHPAAVADPRQGDYVESPEPQTAAWYRHYAEHDSPPASLRHVMRAAFLSDTSPPLYDVVLYFWTRAAGTSDVSLKGLSILFALASFPLLCTLARRVGGRAAALWACALYSLAPFSIWYSTEGRMYSLMWFLVCVQMLLTLSLPESEKRRGFLWTGWALNAAAGLLTHYFFGFVFVACCAWLLLHPRRVRRNALIAALVVVGALVMPWYLHVPESIHLWRVTGDWLKIRPSGEGVPLAGPVGLAWSLLSPRGYWGGRRIAELVALGAVAAILVLLFASRRLSWRNAFSGRRQLLWLCLAAAALGPVALDIPLHSHTSWIPRYAAAGLPAAVLLLGLAISRVPNRVRYVVAGVLLLSWSTGVRRCIINPARSYGYFRELGVLVDQNTDPKRDIIIVDSIPSGVVGMARYMKTTTPMVSWVPGLRPEQIPPKVATLVGPGGRIVLVKIHNLGRHLALEDWLRHNASEEKENFSDLYPGAITLFRFPAPGVSSPLLTASHADFPSDGKCGSICPPL